MNDSYQAIYDAARSRIRGVDIGEAVADVARQSFDISQAVAGVVWELNVSAMEHRRPSVLYRPALTKDGNQWCALYGENLQEGVAGFGDTADAAMIAFDLAWLNERIRSEG